MSTSPNYRRTVAAGLPMSLRSRTARAYFGPTAARHAAAPYVVTALGDGDLGSWASSAVNWVKKTVSSPKRVIKFVAGAATAPITAPLTVAAQVVNKATGGKVAPLNKFDTWVGKNEVLEAGRIVGGAAAIVGGAVGGGVIAAPVIGGAASAVGSAVAANAGLISTLAPLAAGALASKPPPQQDVSAASVEEVAPAAPLPAQSGFSFTSPAVLATVGGVLALGILAIALRPRRSAAVVAPAAAAPAATPPGAPAAQPAVAGLSRRRRRRSRRSR